MAGCGAEPLGRIELGETQGTVAFHLEETSAVQLWAEVEVATDDIDLDRPVERFPHITSVIVSAEGPAGAVFERTCDPFEARVFKWLQKSPEGRRYEGKLARCQFTAEAGDYVLSARLETRVEHDKYRVERVVLIPRARPTGG